LQDYSRKSNLTIASNIWVLKTPKGSLDEDTDVVSHIQGKPALLKFYHKFLFTYSQALSFVQKNELNSGGCAGYIPPNYLGGNIASAEQRRYGRVYGKQEEIVWSCRCERTDCLHYEDCMQLPYAKRIERSVESSPFDSKEKLVSPELTWFNQEIEAAKTEADRKKLEEEVRQKALEKVRLDKLFKTSHEEEFHEAEETLPN
jgi:hypothetical protein